MKLQNLKRISQAAFLAVTLTGIIVGTTGIVYPYFFCYSNPWDVGSCPLGLLEHGSVDIQITFMVGLSLLLYLFGFLSLMGVIFGRAFCGWACPIGALQDITKKFGISDKVRKKLKPSVNPKFKYVKYLILMAIPVTAYLSKDLFYTNLCPVGGVTGTIPTLLFYPSEWTLGSGFPVKITSVILFILLVILVIRGWCKYLCPIGAFLGPWNKVSAAGLRRDESTCKNCNLCEKKCPMDVKDIGRKADSECLLCGRCVDSCKFGSLKLGILPFRSKKMMAVWTVLLFVSASMLAGGAWLDGYTRADEINSMPCLGCLALDPFQAAEWRTTDDVQPNFVLEPLASRPVFLHYRTDVCPGCDEMEPHIAILESQYGDQVEFIHINLDHATAEEDASYDIYDFAGTPTARFGVPMFTTIIVEMNGNESEISYMTQYGSSADQGASKRLELEETIIEANGRHSAAAAPVVPIDPSDAIVLSELFVDMGCVNCYKSEHALIELESTGETSFATFVTNAPGVSGQYAAYREEVYEINFGPAVIGHPWVVFAGGPNNTMGALTTASALSSYRTTLAAQSLAPVNVSVVGYMSKSGDTLLSNITITNIEATDQSFLVEAFVVERLSRWTNLQGEPVPNAFVDIVANGTFGIPAGTSATIPVIWNGTAQLRISDMRMGNTGMLVTVWKDGVQVTSRMIVSSEPDVLLMTAERSMCAALPNGTAEFNFTLRNFNSSGMEVGLEIEKPASWDAELSASSIYIPGDGTVTFSITLTGNGTSSDDPVSNFTVKAEGTQDHTIQASSKVQVDVRDDIAPPVVVAPTSLPNNPRADEAITVTVVVGDDTGVASVQLSYFSCTPEACSPYYIVDMNQTSGNSYSASVYPIAEDHTDFHYRIIAEDVHGNTVTTELNDVELEPVVQHVDAEKPKIVGVILLIVFAIIAILVALSSREKPGKELPENKDSPSESADTSETGKKL